ncbi:MAG TPA: DUF3052 domain-containing protein [Myxococcales bacterium]|jgi:hypothetical protein|nr:DUF3052 domain-containing protein [Myxococcales bacterium]
MAGYSGTPLPRKLGIKEGARLRFLAAPDTFANSLGPLPAAVRFAARGPADVVVFFTRQRAELQRRFAELARGLDPAGGLWIAWPKRSSGVPTDLDENLVREVGLSQGLVDNKVCAIDETWSGLRFVVRVADRQASQATSRKSKRNQAG